MRKGEHDHSNNRFWTSKISVIESNETHVQVYIQQDSEDPYQTVEETNNRV